MIRIIICDDDSEFCVQEKQKIDLIMKSRFDYISYEMDMCNSGDELYEKNEEIGFDIVFLDIEVGAENGFEIAGQMKKRWPEIDIVFITTHDNLVYDSFEYRPLGFVRKQYFDTEFPDLMNRVVRQMLGNRKLVTIGELKDKKTYMTDEICMITAFGHYLIVKSKNGEIKIRASFSKVSRQLEDYGFVEINKGIIVNADYVKIVDGSVVVTKDGDSLQIKRGHFKEVKQQVAIEQMKGKK